MKILFIDHNDSFSNNIVSFFRTKKFRVDVTNYSDTRLLEKNFPISEYHLIILSPGPGSPADYPQTIEFYRHLPKTMLVLGVCLGHQIMLYADGGQIQQICNLPIHGRQIYLNAQVISPFLGKIRLAGTAVLYNSLGCFKNDPVFNTWQAHIIQNRVCLIAEHRNRHHIGVQFHPESFASSIGTYFFNKFIRAAKRHVA